MMPSLSH
ncbi:Protein of unknown function [Leuconostoc citreum]|nr:Protein of unknown function [Leuconostoc citreum LBAE C10]CCF26754.1 Protein of unknown function [Leuconostoc citreum LBAE C11]CCF28193.1 Protein of unknown function [Leuconostoc citreum LBAE E16]CDX64252.1 Protein of unknown function [Leuconostoc citreum]CDX65973.1 Protein of unknown function [Leuconostoc citreum]